jgi:glutamine phosphoribosylpyrophosphate amidotransferase
MFGVDMPPNDSFIARGRTQEEISKIMKMPVYYISSEGMLKAFEKVGIAKEDLCTYCIGGKHPFK